MRVCYMWQDKPRMWRGVYAVVRWCRPSVCVWVSAGADCDKPRLFEDKATRSGIGREDEEGRDKRARTTKKEARSKREGTTWTGKSS